MVLCLLAAMGETDRAHGLRTSYEIVELIITLCSKDCEMAMTGADDELLVTAAKAKARAPSFGQAVKEGRQSPLVDSDRLATVAAVGLIDLQLADDGHGVTTNVRPGSTTVSS